MFQIPTGEEIFVLDAHVHFWDARASNIRNVHGQQFIDCFYGFHKLGPPEYHWDKARFDYPGPERMVDDLFVHGYTDMAICQPTYLSEFYHNGFNTTERNAEMRERHPDRFIVNGAFDPRDGDAGLDYLDQLAETYHIQGVKLYTAEWRGASKGYKLSEPAAYRYLERCEKLGIKNIHVHKGPTILPLSYDAFNVTDIDDAATSFQNLNFIVDHCGMPRLDDFCWIATQETNVYAGLAAVMALQHARPDYFGRAMAEILFFLGEDKMLYGSDYSIWSPRWQIEKFMAYEIPAHIADEVGTQLTLEGKKKIMGLNAARLYNVDPAAPRLPLETGVGAA